MGPWHRLAWSRCAVGGCDMLLVLGVKARMSQLPHHVSRDQEPEVLGRGSQHPA